MFALLLGNPLRTGTGRYTRYMHKVDVACRARNLDLLFGAFGCAASFAVEDVESKVGSVRPGSNGGSGTGWESRTRLCVVARS